MPKGTRASRKKKKQLQENKSDENENNYGVSQEKNETPQPVREEQQNIPKQIVPSRPKLGPDDLEYQDLDQNSCTVIPFNISIEEWTSGVVSLQEIPFKPPRKLPFEIYGRAKTLATYCKESKVTKGIFFGGDFENIFVVELPGVSYVCLTATTSKQKLQRNQLLHLLLSGDSKVPYGNALLLECEKASTYLKYKGVGRKRAIQLLNRLLQDKMIECFETDENIQRRFWDNDKLRQGTWFGTSVADFENVNRWGLDSSLMLEHYKTHKCSRALQHEKKNCPFYHSLADARRSPLQFYYSEERCTYTSIDCPEGVDCGKSHNELEHYYHPNFFRRINCIYFGQKQLVGEDMKEIIDTNSRQKNCKGPLCSFFHPGEMSAPVFREEKATSDNIVPQLDVVQDSYTPLNTSSSTNSNSPILTSTPAGASLSTSKNAWSKTVSDTNLASGSNGSSITSSGESIANESPKLSVETPAKQNIPQDFSLQGYPNNQNANNNHQDDEINNVLEREIYFYSNNNNNNSSIFSNNTNNAQHADDNWGYYSFSSNIFQPETQPAEIGPLQQAWRFGAVENSILHGYINEVRSGVLQILVQYIKYYLFNLHPTNWLGVLIENCAHINPSNLSNVFQWDFQICNAILVKIQNQKENSRKDSPKDLLSAYVEFHQSTPPQKIDFREFNILMKLLNCLKYESKISNFTIVETLIQKFEIKYIYTSNPYFSNFQNQLFQDFTSFTWNNLTKHFLNFNNNFTYILVGNIPSQIDPKLFYSLPFSLVLDFNPYQYQLGANIRKQFKDPFKFYETTINEFKAECLDENKVTWLQMRTLENLSDESYSKNYIGGIGDEVLLTICKKLAQKLNEQSKKTEVVCITLFNNEDLQYISTLMLKKHVSHCLKSIYRFDDFNTTFLSFVESPVNFINLFKEPVLQRSIEFMSNQEFYIKLSNLLEETKKYKNQEYAPILPASIDLLKVKDIIFNISQYYEIPLTSAYLPSESVMKESLHQFLCHQPVNWNLLIFEDNISLPKREIFFQLNQTILELLNQSNQQLIPLSIILFKKSGSGATTLARQIARNACLSYPTFFLQSKVLSSKTNIILHSIKLLQSLYEKTRTPIFRIIDNFNDLELLNSFQLNFPSVTLYIMDESYAIDQLSSIPKNSYSISLSREISQNESKQFCAFFNIVKSLYGANDKSSYDIPEDYQLINTLFLKESLQIKQPPKIQTISNQVLYMLKPVLKKYSICRILVLISLIHRYTGESLPIKYIQSLYPQSNREKFNFQQFICNSEEVASLFICNEKDLTIRTIHLEVAELIVQHLMKEQDFQYSTLIIYLLRSTIASDLPQNEPIIRIISKLLYGFGQQRNTFSEFLQKLSYQQALDILVIADECFQNIDSAYIKAKYIWNKTEKNIQTFNTVMNIFNDIYNRCKTDFSDSFHLFYLLKGHLYSDFLKYSINSIATNNISNSIIQNIDESLAVLCEIHENACSSFQKSKGCLMGRKYHILQYILPYYFEFQTRFEFIVHYISIRIPDSCNFSHPTYEKIDNVSSINLQFLELTFPANLVDYRNRCFELVYELEQLLAILRHNISEHGFDPSICERENYNLLISTTQISAIVQVFQKSKRKLFQLFGSGVKDFDTLSTISNLPPRSKQELRRINIWNFLNDYKENFYVNTWNENYMNAVFSMTLENLENSFVPDSATYNYRDSDMISYLILARRLWQSNLTPAITNEINNISTRIQHWVNSTHSNNNPIVAHYYQFIVHFIEYIEFCNLPENSHANYRFKKDEMKNRLLSILEKCESILNENYFPNELRFYSHEFLVNEGAGIQSLFPIQLLSKVPPEKHLRLRGKISYSSDRYQKKKETKCILFENIPIFCDTKLDIFKDDKYLNQYVTFNVMFSWRSPRAFGILFENKNLEIKNQQGALNNIKRDNNNIINNNMMNNNYFDQKSEEPKSKKKAKFTKINLATTPIRWKGRVTNVDVMQRIIYVIYENYQIYIMEDQFDVEIEYLKKGDFVEFEPKENTSYSDPSKKYKGIRAFKINT